MPKRITIAPHLSVEELGAAYRRARDGVARSHWQIIWQLASGRTSAEVAAITGYSPGWIRTLARRYNRQGPAGLADGRQRNPGQRRLLNTVQEAHLRWELAQAEQAGQPWNGVQVAQWMSGQLGHRVHPVRGWEVLKRWGFRRKVPRPRHAKADPDAQAWFKKT